MCSAAVSATTSDACSDGEVRRRFATAGRRSTSATSARSSIELTRVNSPRRHARKTRAGLPLLRRAALTTRLASTVARTLAAPPLPFIALTPDPLDGLRYEAEHFTGVLVSIAAMQLVNGCKELLLRPGLQSCKLLRANHHCHRAALALDDSRLCCFTDFDDEVRERGARLGDRHMRCHASAPSAVSN